MEILKHRILLKSLVLFRVNCHAKVAPDIRREFAARLTDGQKAADAMVKARRPSSTPGSGRRSQQRSSGAPHIQAAETSQSIEDRVDVRTDTTAA
jgi:hypothetical protein